MKALSDDLQARLVSVGRTGIKRGLARLGVDVRRMSSPARIHDMRSFLVSIRKRGVHVKSAIDVGAHRGDWTRLALGVFPDVAVMMIEPLIEMTNYLDDICNRNRRCQWRLAAAGPRSGRLTMTVAPDLAGSSLLRSPRVVGTERDVRVLTIDSLLQSGEVQPPQLVKLDVQGFELEALSGGTSLFGLVEVFIVEVSLFEFLPGMPTIDEVILLMREHGYVFYDIAGVLRRPLDGALAQVDACFTLRTGRLRDSNAWQVGS